ncbi:MAG: type IV pilin protein [Burkholderiaceae bacterium]
MIRRSASKGFTLIEALITMSLIAILAAIALPSYDSYIRRQKVRLAQSDLVALSLAMENRFQQQISYPSVSADVAAIRAALPSWTPGSDSGDFAFAITASDGSGYTLQASGVSSRLSGCTIELESDNSRSLSGCGGGSTWF